jgi:hypothetical protein
MTFKNAGIKWAGLFRADFRRYYANGWHNSVKIDKETEEGFGPTCKNGGGNCQHCQCGFWKKDS